MEEDERKDITETKHKKTDRSFDSGHVMYRSDEGSERCEIYFVLCESVSERLNKFQGFFSVSVDAYGVSHYIDVLTGDGFHFTFGDHPDHALYGNIGIGDH